MPCRKPVTLSLSPGRPAVTGRALTPGRDGDRSAVVRPAPRPLDARVHAFESHRDLPSSAAEA